jgi:para-nitrobenzyl esterase
MVFLFGGGFSTGSAATEAQWLTEQNVVVVTINYRVGALGFMVHPALDAALGLASGNLGLRDQQLGLRWVRDNIAAFGGDPARVLLFGESAGALSTCLHLVARGSEGLADAFVMQSGACVAGTGSLRRRERVVAASTQLASAFCPLQEGSALVGCLRARAALDFASPLAPGVAAAEYWPLRRRRALRGRCAHAHRTGQTPTGPAHRG